MGFLWVLTNRATGIQCAATGLANALFSVLISKKDQTHEGTTGPFTLVPRAMFISFCLLLYSPLYSNTIWDSSHPDQGLADYSPGVKSSLYFYAYHLRIFFFYILKEHKKQNKASKQIKDDRGICVLQNLICPFWSLQRKLVNLDTSIISFFATLFNNKYT